jgi:hypothetical protein
VGDLVELASDLPLGEGEREEEIHDRLAKLAKESEVAGGLGAWLACGGFNVASD